MPPLVFAMKPDNANLFLPPERAAEFDVFTEGGWPSAATMRRAKDFIVSYHPNRAIRETPADVLETWKEGRTRALLRTALSEASRVEQRVADREERYRLKREARSKAAAEREIARYQAEHEGTPDSMRGALTAAFADQANLWVHYSNTGILEVNPRQSHNDPAGIYFFPADIDYVKPFFADRVSTFVCEYTGGRVFDLSTMTYEDGVQFIKSLGMKPPIEKRCLADMDAARIRQAEVEEAAATSGRRSSLGTTWRSFFWQYMRRSFKGNDAAFAALFKKAGYAAIWDETGAIFEGEDKQLCVFDKASLKVVEHRVAHEGAAFEPVQAAWDAVVAELKKFGEVSSTVPAAKKRGSLTELYAWATLKGVDAQRDDVFVELRAPYKKDVIELLGQSGDGLLASISKAKGADVSPLVSAAKKYVAVRADKWQAFMEANPEYEGYMWNVPAKVKGARIWAGKDHKKSIVFDFDGTIAEDVGHPDIGEPIAATVELMRKAKDAGIEVVIQSCRWSEHHLSDALGAAEGLITAVAWLEEHDVPYDRLAAGKPLAEAYYDDKAVNVSEPEKLDALIESLASGHPVDGGLRAAMFKNFFVDPSGSVYPANEHNYTAEELVESHGWNSGRLAWLERNPCPAGEDEDTWDVEGAINFLFSEGWFRCGSDGELLFMHNALGMDDADVQSALESIPDDLRLCKFLTVDLGGKVTEVPVLEGEDALDAWKHRKDIRHRVTAGLRFLAGLDLAAERYHYKDTVFDVDRGYILAGPKDILVEFRPSLAMIDGHKIDEKHALTSADLEKPVLIGTLVDKAGRSYTRVIDGNHRVFRAVKEGKPFRYKLLSLQETLSIAGDSAFVRRMRLRAASDKLWVSPEGKAYMLPNPYSEHADSLGFPGMGDVPGLEEDGMFALLDAGWARVGKDSDMQQLYVDTRGDVGQVLSRIPQRFKFAKTLVIEPPVGSPSSARDVIPVLDGEMTMSDVPDLMRARVWETRPEWVTASRKKDSDFWVSPYTGYEPLGYATGHGEALDTFPDFTYDDNDDNDPVDQAISLGWVRGLTDDVGNLYLEVKDISQVEQVLAVLPTNRLFPPTLGVENRAGSRITVPVLEGEDALDAWKHRKDIRHRVTAAPNLGRAWIDNAGKFIPIPRTHAEYFVPWTEENKDQYEAGTDDVMQAMRDGWVRVIGVSHGLTINCTGEDQVEEALQSLPVDWLIRPWLNVDTDKGFLQIKVLEGEDALGAWQHRHDPRHRVEAGLRLAATGTGHSWGCLMADFPAEFATEAQAWAKANIADENVYDTDDHEYGRETHIHTTVAYGIDPKTDPEDIQFLLYMAQRGPLKVKLGAVSKFEKDDYDVIKVEVESPDLHRLHAEADLQIGLPGNTYPDFIPHVTLAYVLPGTADELLGSTPFAGQEFELTGFEYSYPPEEGAKDVKVHYDTANLKAQRGVSQKFWVSVHDGFFRLDPEFEDGYESSEHDQEGDPKKLLRKGWVRGEFGSKGTLFLNAISEDRIAWALDLMPSGLLFVKELVVELGATESAECYSAGTAIPVLEGEDALDAWKRRNDVRHRVAAGANGDLPAGIRFHSGIKDAHRGEQWGYSVATVDGKTVAGLDWSYYNDVVRVDMIEVKPEFRRMGVATGLWKSFEAYVKEGWPTAVIDKGYATADGWKWLQSMGETRREEGWLHASLTFAGTSPGVLDIHAATVRHDPTLPGEGRALPGEDAILTGPKFDGLPDEAKAHVLAHEEGHLFEDRFMGTDLWWSAPELLNAADLNGQTTPAEIWAEAYAVWKLEPAWLTEKHPALAAVMPGLVDKHKITAANPLPLKIDDAVLDKMVQKVLYAYSRGKTRPRLGRQYLTTTAGDTELGELELPNLLGTPVRLIVMASAHSGGKGYSIRSVGGWYLGARQFRMQSTDGLTDYIDVQLNGDRPLAARRHAPPWLREEVKQGMRHELRHGIQQRDSRPRSDKDFNEAATATPGGANLSEAGWRAYLNNRQEFECRLGDFVENIERVLDAQPDEQYLPASDSAALKLVFTQTPLDWYRQYMTPEHVEKLQQAAAVVYTAWKEGRLAEGKTKQRKRDAFDTALAVKKAEEGVQAQQLNAADSPKSPIDALLSQARQAVEDSDRWADYDNNPALATQLGDIQKGIGDARSREELDAIWTKYGIEPSLDELARRASSKSAEKSDSKKDPDKGKADKADGSPIPDDEEKDKD